MSSRPRGIFFSGSKATAADEFVWRPCTSPRGKKVLHPSRDKSIGARTVRVLYYRTYSGERREGGSTKLLCDPGSELRRRSDGAGETQVFFVCMYLCSIWLIMSRFRWQHRPDIHTGLLSSCLDRDIHDREHIENKRIKISTNMDQHIIHILFLYTLYHLFIVTGLYMPTIQGTYCDYEHTRESS